MLKEKHYLLSILSLAIIIVCLFPTFTNATSEVNVKSLLEKRTSILENGYEKNISPEETEKLLQTVETNPILKRDMENLKGWGKADFDKVKNMHIKEITKVKDSFGYMSYKLDVVWSMNGLDKNYALDSEYNLVLKQVGETYKIYLFELI